MKDKISSIVQYTLPEFVVDEYSLFTLFIKSYYEFMEEEGNALNFIERFQDSLDIDQADDDFVVEYLQEFADTFPKDLLVDEATLIKYIKEFYLSKGSEDSFKFIFTMVYNAKIETIYPREFLHESSNGTWISEDYMYITADNFDKLTIGEELNAFVVGETTGASAVIDTITTFYYNEELVMKLDLSSYKGQFSETEDITLTIDDYSVVESAFLTINTIGITAGGKNYHIDDTITISGGGGSYAKAKIKQLHRGSYDEYTIGNGGSGYAVNDLIYATPQVEDTGYGFVARVATVGGGGEITAIDIMNGGYEYRYKTTAYVKNSGGTNAVIELNGNDIGRIKEIEVFDSGIGYTTQPSIVINSTDGVGATLVASLKTIYNGPKYYKDQNDWLSNYDRIQDSYLYQKFSYIVKSDISPHKWIKQLKRLTHPSGTQLFGMYALTSEFNVAISIPDDIIRSIFITIELINDINNINITYANTEILKTLEQSSVCPIDLTDNDLDYIKFFDSFNYTVDTFKDYTIDQVITHCRDIMTYQDDSIITIE